MKNVSVWAMVTAVVILGAGIIGTTQANVSDRIEIQISPSMIVLSQTMDYISVHTNIPHSLVDRDSLALERIPVDRTKSDNLGNLVAKVDADAVKAILTPGRVELTLTGLTKTGYAFSASDLVTVKQ